MRYLLPLLALTSACATTSSVKGTDMKLTATPKASSLLAGSVTDFTATCDSTLARAKSMVAELKALPPGSDAKVLSLYDEVTTAMSNMGARSGLAKEVHPDEKFREACEKCEQQI